jgi:alkylation response protein AidB-like acyl-CoA dehydrogenase
MKHAEPSSDDKLMIEAIDQFCRRRLPPEEVRRRDENHIPPYDLVPELAEMGLIRAGFPEEIGGLGLPWSSVCRLQERLAYHAYSASSLVNRFISFGAMPIRFFGSEAQKAEFLPQILNGKVLVALALSEPEAGSDARAVRSRAARQPGGLWKIHGRKTWISDAGQADYLLTLCRTPGEDGGEHSLTAFLIPRRTAGVSMTPIAKIGNNCMPSWDIGLDEVEVDDRFRLGAVGKGFATITGTLKYSRASVSAATLGTAQAALDLAIAHATERMQFGKHLSEFQVIKHRLVDMHIEIRKARAMTYELARVIDAGEPAEEMGAIAKLVATEALQYVTHHGMQILASAGYAVESAMQRYWRDGRLYTFGEGTNEIQREIIANQIGLAKPRKRASGQHASKASS